MADPVTTNKGLAVPVAGSDSGTWATPINGDFTAIDLMLGGTASIALSASNYTIGTGSASELQCFMVKLSGTLLANVTVFSAVVGFYVVENNCTGNFTVNWQANFGSGGVGSSLLVPQGSRVLMASDTSAGARFVNPIGGAIPSGVIQAYAGSSAPSGWVLCFGQAISRIINAGLFTAIGTTYGVGDGSTTFNVPDLRGRSIFGLDNMGGSAANRLVGGQTGNITSPTTLGASGGEENHTLLTSEMPSHSHVVNDPGHTHTVNAAIQLGDQHPGGSGFNDATNSTLTTNSSTTGISIQSQGGGGVHNTTPPAMVVNWIIKT